MRHIITSFLLFFSLISFAQSPRLARSYYNNSDYKKAVEIYKVLHQKHVYRTDYFKFLISSYQQTQNFSAAEHVITKQINKYPSQKQFNVELGYNFALQNKNVIAKKYYDIALNAVKKNPNLAYNTGLAFQNNDLLDYAIKVYQTAMKLNNKLNFDVQIASIYGQQGDLENMFNTFLDIVNNDASFTQSILKYIGKFIEEDSQAENNILLKKLLIKRIQTNPNTSWNMLLSWLFMQEKQYKKAFVQEIAIYKRQQNDLSRIFNLGKITFKDDDLNTASLCFNYILKNTTNNPIKIQSNLYLIKIDIEKVTNPKELEAIQTRFKQLLNNYGFNTNTFKVQIEYANFLTFKLNQPKKAIDLIQKTLTLPLSNSQKGQLKLKLADIFVFSNQLNQALLSYTQVKINHKNSIISQLATFKIAQTSYYKGDFKWAQTQLKVLKSETSQLIANDALKLSLLISNNTQNGNSKALHYYAKAELLSYQNKDQIVIDNLNYIINNFKGYPIEPYALNKQADIYQKLNNYSKSEQNYLNILKLYKNSILADDACFKLAKLYQNKLDNLNKAKSFYEKIIFEYPSSIYLVEARNIFRTLKPDLIN